MLHAWIDNVQQAAALQHSVELERLRNEIRVCVAAAVQSQIPHSDSFQAQMDARLQDLLRKSQESFNQAIEQRERELDKRLLLTQEAMRVCHNIMPSTFTHTYMLGRKRNRDCDLGAAICLA